MRGVEMMNKENIKKAVMEVKTSFMNMGKVSKSILKVSVCQKYIKNILKRKKNGCNACGIHPFS
jgi:hypothetical protein